MHSLPANPRSLQYRPALAAVSALGTAWVFLLVMLGAFTTSIGAGMAFPDWPLSNGSLNPQGWLDNLAMFAEHSHRLSAGVMSTVTIVLAVWISRTDGRAWLRRLAWFAVGLVLLQAVVGGLRVLLDHQHVDLVNTSVGRLFAMLHACLAQLFACTLIAVAVSCSRAWLRGSAPVGAAVRRAGVLCCSLLFVQLGIAAVMRHSFAGLAIPTFPYSNDHGGWLPDAWDFRVAIHFAHRVMAGAITIAVAWFVFTIRRERAAPVGLRLGGWLLLGLLGLQLALGAEIIWTQRSAAVTTGHVLVGALTLASTFWLTWLAHRDRIESVAPAA
jgi:cytochrome c oxidase assembly protein subunit 15